MVKLKKFLVDEIEFDFDDWHDRNWDFPLSKEDQEYYERNTLGVWEAYDEDHLLDSISDRTGWCIKHINYYHFFPNKELPVKS